VIVTEARITIQAVDCRLCFVMTAAIAMKPDIGDLHLIAAKSPENGSVHSQIDQEGWLPIAGIGTSLLLSSDLYRGKQHINDSVQLTNTRTSSDFQPFSQKVLASRSRRQFR
jgi:hypothetical protein